MIKKSSLFIILILFSSTASAQTNQTEKGDFSALFFGDYYWFANHHNPDIEGNNGFWIRRIYLTYDHKISGSLSARFRLEMESEGDFVTKSELIPEVKDAWIKYKFGQQQIIAGISPTPSNSLANDVWGYRNVDRPPLGLQEIGSSRGLGVSIKGKIGEPQRLGYQLMVTNGSGRKTELNRGKKFMLAVSYKLTENLIIQAYGDYELADNNDHVYTMQGFMAYQSEALNIGALYAYNWQDATSTGLNIYSLFSNFDIATKLRGFLRFDFTTEPNPRGNKIDYHILSDEAPIRYFTGGLDIQLHPQVSLLPNVQTVFYGKTDLGETPDTDFIARLTLTFTL